MPRPRRRSGLTLAALEKMLSQRRREIDELTKDRQRILKQLAAVDARLRAAGSTVGPSAFTPAGRARNDKSLVATLEDVLSHAGRPLNVGEIVQGVTDAGYQSASANFRAVVNQALIRERKRFASPSRAVYQLKGK